MNRGGWAPFSPPLPLKGWSWCMAKNLRESGPHCPPSSVEGPPHDTLVHNAPCVDTYHVPQTQAPPYGFLPETEKTPLFQGSKAWEGKQA